MARSGPPAYAWDWFARQHLLWREVRARLASGGSPAARRYAVVDARADVVPMLRADYPREEDVRAAVDAVVAEIAFLGRTDRPFAALGVRSAPRGMRWWWTALTGEELDGPPAPRGAVSSARSGAQQLAIADLAEVDTQLALDNVHEGYGD